jgi:hypothetical protein
VKAAELKNLRENQTINMMQMTAVMIKRDMITELMEVAREYPMVVIFGSRQSGKPPLFR